MSEAILNAFWQLLSKADQRVLLLDYDGTLAPFREKRDEAVPYPGVREILDSIQKGGLTRLVIISGRAIRDLLPLLNMKHLPEIWGCHGWERLLQDGRIQTGALPAPAKDALEEALRWGIKKGHGEHCEEKPTAVAFHWRGKAPSLLEGLKKEVQAAWQPLASRGGLDLHPFDGGVELRCPGRDKGYVVERILAESDEEAVVAYLGDDLTDEDAFRALKGRGLSVLARREHRPTAADIWIRPPAGVLEFLNTWNIVCEKERI